MKSQKYDGPSCPVFDCFVGCAPHILYSIYLPFGAHCWDCFQHSSIDSLLDECQNVGSVLGGFGSQFN